MIIGPELVQNPRGPKSGVGTTYSISDFISKNTDRLLDETQANHWYVVKSVVCYAAEARWTHRRSNVNVMATSAY